MQVALEGASQIGADVSPSRGKQGSGQGFFGTGQWQEEMRSSPWTGRAALQSCASVSLLLNSNRVSPPWMIGEE